MFIHKGIITFINYLLFIILAYALVELAWLLLLPAYQGVNTNGLVQVKQKQYNQPIAKALFGEIAKKAIIKKKAKVVKTRLNLILKGVWLNQEVVEKSYVIIEISGKDKIYYLDDKISSLAIIVEIHQRYIILNRSGIRESLYLRKNESTLTTKETTIEEKTKLKPTLNNRERKQLNKIRDSLKTNPWSLSKIMKLKPFYKSGQLVGFKIRPGKERRLFYKLGLEPGDIVYKINGSQLVFSELNDVLNGVIRGGSVSIDLYRNDRQYFLVLNL